MNKILLITSREYLSRVKKKSFIIMTLLGPLLIALFYSGIIYMAVSDSMGSEEKKILVVDRSGFFKDQLEDTKKLKFFYSENLAEPDNDALAGTDYYALLFIPKITLKDPTGIRMISEEQPSLSTVSTIESRLEHKIESLKLTELGIDKKVIDDINTSLSIETARATESGLESTSTLATTGIGFFSAILIYIFIFLYGVQVMRGVIEEKTNRIVEVIISSVKPFQLMMGKILGIAMVGLTQFLVWVLLSMALITVATGVMGIDINPEQTAQIEQVASGTNVAQVSKAQAIMTQFSSINFTLIISMFLFYFITGYLFYSALFAAIGSAVDNETETQQFMLPVTIPLIFGFVAAQSAVVNNPDSALAFWLSMIPFTSPVVMMVRIPFGVAGWELALSMGLMVGGFILTTLLAAKIYRVGILMFGKKASYKELAKWLMYKN